MIIIFEIMSSLLKCCDNEQELLIMRFVSDFSENHLSWIENNRMSARLIYADHERYKLKQNRCDGKLWCISFYFNKISEIEMNQHERFYERLNKSSKRLSCAVLKDEWLILFFLLTSFKQFCQSTNNLNIESHETFIEIRKSQKYLQLA